jgi:copper oxidase (laccase) domain-containing protein
MSPSLKQESDRMQFFEPPHIEDWQPYMNVGSDGLIHINTTGHNISRFERLGVPQENIYASPVNTYTDLRYFSQRAATELNDPSRFGRMMVAASMTGAPSLLQ